MPIFADCVRPEDGALEDGGGIWLDAAVAPADLVDIESAPVPKSKVCLATVLAAELALLVAELTLGDVTDDVRPVELRAAALAEVVIVVASPLESVVVTTVRPRAADDAVGYM